MSTATTSIATCASDTCATAPKVSNPDTPEKRSKHHLAQTHVLLAAMALHHMEDGQSTDGLDDAFNLLTMALHGVETLRSWYLHDLAQGYSPITTEGYHHA
nr:hypothetical protein [uncultured Albidiferax sp.]